MPRWFPRARWLADQFARDGGWRQVEALAPYIAGLVAAVALLATWAQKG